MSAFVDKLIADLEARAQSAFSQVGAIVADDLRKTISKPVGFRIGKRGGSVPIRSRPGEPPRREFGNYIASIDQTTAKGVDRVMTTIFTDNPIGGFLERGTSRMVQRPHFKPIFDEYAGGVRKLVGDRIFKSK